MTDTQSGYYDWRCLLGALLIGSAFLYPVYFAIILANDSVFGDRVIITQLVHFSQREVWHLFWSDWQASLPAAYGICLPTLLFALFAQRLIGYSIFLTLPLIAVAVSLAISFIVFGDYSVQLTAIALLYSVPAAWIITKCPTR